MDADHVVRLALEDGTVFTGRGFGAAATGVAAGEVVFNTAMSGYQEALTDPSYAGQILVMTATQIGNYGVNDEDMESAAPTVVGFVVRERSRRVSSHRAAGDLDGWLRAGGVPGLEGIDTRALVRRLRDHGAMRGAMTADAAIDDRALVEHARRAPAMSGCDLASTVTPRAAGTWNEGLGSWRPAAIARRTVGEPRVLAIDCGAKRNIYRHLAERGCRVEVAPLDVDAATIRAAAPDGLFVSNGPGDPAAVQRTIETLRAVAGEVPTFGICLGHQLLALALGARTYKLPFGHRGANQPVRCLLTDRVEITSQNHGFCVDADSLAAAGGVMTHVHLNDGTLAGFCDRERPLFSVQYHPEASPGPHDSSYLFDCFVAMMEEPAPFGRALLERAGVAMPVG